MDSNENQIIQTNVLENALTVSAHIFWADWWHCHNMCQWHRFEKCNKIIFKACVGDAGADSVGSSGCLKTSQSNDSFTLGQSNDSFSHQMSSLTLNPNEPEIENNNVLEQNSALQNNNRPRFSLNDLNVSLIPYPLYIFWLFCSLKPLWVLVRLDV